MRKQAAKKPAKLAATQSATLSAAAEKWRKEILEQYAITDSAGLLLLQTAMESFDAMREAQRLVSLHGALVKDRLGTLKANPACAYLRDSRAAMLSSFKALNLDLEPPKPVGRPHL
ncbi:MAG: hypothetical protein WBM09_12135 [Gallionella sp.]